MYKYFLTVFCLTFLSVGCSWTYRSKSAKVGDLEVGNAYPPAVLADGDWRGMTISDTIFNQGGYSWAGKVLQHEAGRIFVEADFFEGTQINRIRVETPEWESPQQLRVGMTWGDMLQRADKRRWVGVLLSDYGVWDVVDKRYDRIHYLLPDSALLDFSQMAPETPIQAIVMM